MKDGFDGIKCPKIKSTTGIDIAVAIVEWRILDGRFSSFSLFFTI
jgi:hypothetical protein